MSIIMRFPEGKSKVFTTSYDDGLYQDYKLVDIMNKNGIKGTFNINGGLRPCNDAVKPYESLSANQVKNLYIPCGHEVALHTFSHPTLVDIPIENVSYEYLKDKEALESITGKIIRGSAYPNSRYNDKVMNALRACGVDYARNGGQSENFELPFDWLQLCPTARHTNPKLFELGKLFLETEVGVHYPSIMFYLMGHSYEFDNNNNWDVIEKFLELMGRHDDIWYATNIEIYDYINAYNSVRYNLACTIAENPTSTDVWISKNGTTYIIPAGKITTL